MILLIISVSWIVGLKTNVVPWHEANTEYYEERYETYKDMYSEEFNSCKTEKQELIETCNTAIESWENSANLWKNNSNKWYDKYWECNDLGYKIYDISKDWKSLATECTSKIVRLTSTGYVYNGYSRSYWCSPLELW